MPITGYMAVGGGAITAAKALDQINIIGTSLGTFGLVRVTDIQAIQTLWTPTSITVLLPVRADPNHGFVGAISIVDLSTLQHNLTEVVGPSFTTHPRFGRIGDLVHYVTAEVDRAPYPGKHLPAIIYGLNGSTVFLQVLAGPSDGSPYQTDGRWKKTVVFDGDAGQGTWHWPE